MPGKRSSLIGRFLRDDSGSMAIMFAVAIILGMMFSAFAVDEIALYQERRVAQSSVDLASIAAAADPANAFAIAKGVLVDAGLLQAGVKTEDLLKSTSSTRLAVDPGAYVPNASVAANVRFEAGKTPYNAVRVSFTQKGTLYFAKGWGEEPDIGVAAIATTTPIVAFSVGSRLLQLKDGIGNAVLNSLLGSSITLSAVSYNGLANAKVSLFPLLNALANELNITAGTYDDLLKAEASHGVIAKAIAATLTGAEKTTALTLAAALGHNGKIKLGKLFGLGLLGKMPLGSNYTGYLASISALELLTVSAGLSDGSHQVALNLGASVPGLLGITATLAIGEPPQGASWYGIGPSGTIVRTAQIRLKLETRLRLDLLLLKADVNLPIYLEVAYAQAGVKSASCPPGNGGTGSTVINTTPGVVRLVLGEVGSSAFSNFGAPPPVTKATLIGLAGVKVTASAEVNIGQTAPVPLSFSSSEIKAGTIKTAKTTTFTQSLTQRLMDTLDFDIALGPLDLGLSAILEPALRLLILPLTPILDSIINGVLETLGLSLGEADVRVYGVICKNAVLVG